jgi:DNA integrity scanning protein DisA with diadenylate cyclase activity
MDFKEVAYNHIEGEKNGTICATQRKWITKIKREAAKHPKQVIIKTINHDGSVVAEIPHTWFKISPPRVMSEKNKEKMRERMSKTKKENKT